MKKFISLLLCLTQTQLALAAPFAGFITGPGPSAQLLPSYVGGIKFADGSVQSVAASGALASLTISTINSQPGVSDGAQIVGSNLIMQTGTSSVPGLVFTGNLTDSTSGADGILINGGANSVTSASGVQVSQTQASASLPGFLSSADWTSFNGKLANPLTTLGDTLFGGASGVPTRLPGNLTATKLFYTQTGTGSVSASPSWSAILAADLPFPTASTIGGVQSFSPVANQFLTGVSTAGVFSAAQVGFTNISGNLATAQLPTAQTWPTSGSVIALTPVNHGLVVSGSGTQATTIAPDTAGKVLVAAGASADATYMFLTNSNLSGSAAISNANLAPMAANTAKANLTGGSATPSDVPAVATATASSVMTRDVSGATAFTTATGTLVGHATLDLALAGGTMSGNIVMAGFEVTGLPTPSSPSSATSKSYVDSVATGFNAAASVYAASTANLVGTYAGSCVGATFTMTAVGAFVLDGLTVPVSSRVLLKNQSLGFQNGIYILTVAGDGVTQAVLTRAADYDTVGEINTNRIIPVDDNGGTQQGIWFLTTSIATCGTDALSYIPFGSGGSSAGSLQIANNLSDVSNPVTAFNNISGMSALGSLIYGGSSGSRSILPGNITASKQVLTQTGTGSVSAAPAWSTLSFVDLSGNITLAQLPTAVTWPTSGTVFSGTPSQYALLASGTGSTVTMIPPGSTAGVALVSNGSGAYASFGAIDLNSSSSVSSNLPVAHGGTGLSGGVSGGVPYFTAAGTQIASSAALGANLLVVGGGPGAAPSTPIVAGSQFQSLLANFSGNASFQAIPLNQSAAVTGILPNGNTTATSSATANTIVLRNPSAGIAIGALTATGANLSSLTASQAVVTDPSKNLVSLPYASIPATSTLAEFDSQANLLGNNFLTKSQTVVSSGGTTVLSVGSSGTFIVTGSTNQTFQLPLASSLDATFKWPVMIINQSSGVVTVNSSGGNLVATIPSQQQGVITNVLNSGTAAASWYAQVTSSGGGGGSVTSVALSVPAASILSVTGSPVTSAGTLNLQTTGTSGGVPFFSSSSVLTSTNTLTNNQLLVGGGSGQGPKNFPTTGTTSGNALTVNGGVLIWSPVDLSNTQAGSISGTLVTDHGGTGLSSSNTIAYTNHSLIVTQNAFGGTPIADALIAPSVTADMPLLSNINADPSYHAFPLGSTAITSGTLPVGRGGTGTSTAFTTGSVLYAGASGVYTQNNAGFFFDGSRLGIGTNSLSFPLQVSSAQGNNFGIVDTTNSQTLGFTSNSSGFSVINSAAKDLILGTNAGERLRILGGGNVGYVGINQASPQARLHVSSAQQDVAEINFTGGGGGSHSYVAFNTTGTNTNVGARIGQVDNASAGGHFVIETNNTGPGNTTVERVRVTDAGNVGIGTTNPQANLEISSSAAANTSGNELLRLTGNYSTSSGAGLFMNFSSGGTPVGQLRSLTDVNGGSNHGLSLSTFGAGALTERMRVTGQNGYVGIANNNPLGPLDIGGTGGWNYFANSGSGNPSRNFGLMFKWNRSNGNAESSILYGSGVNTPYLEIGRYDGSTVTGDMYFNQGNIGIGTAVNVVPSQKLQVQDTDAAILVGQSDGTHGALYFGNTNHGVKRSPSGSNNNVVLFTSGGANTYLSATGEGGQTLTVSNNSRVGINNNAPNSSLTVQGDEDVTGNLSVGSTATPARLFVNDGGAGGTVVASFRTTGAGGTTCTIAPGAGTPFSCASDERLKEDIKDYKGQDALDLIMGLRPRSFQYKGGAQTHQVGFIAQEVEKSAPQFVSKMKDGYLGVGPIGMVPYLVGAVQELKKENDDLKARLEKLESKGK